MTTPEEKVHLAHSRLFQIPYDSVPEITFPQFWKLIAKQQRGEITDSERTQTIKFMFQVEISKEFKNLGDPGRIQKLWDIYRVLGRYEIPPWHR